MLISCLILFVPHFYWPNMNIISQGWFLILNNAYFKWMTKSIQRFWIWFSILHRRFVFQNLKHIADFSCPRCVKWISTLSESWFPNYCRFCRFFCCFCKRCEATLCIRSWHFLLVTDQNAELKGCRYPPFKFILRCRILLIAVLKRSLNCIDMYL